MPLSAQYIAEQRKRALADMTELCTIEHAAPGTQNDMGEATPDFTGTEPNVRCRIVAVQSLSARERERLSTIGQVSQWMVVLPLSVALSVRDRVIDGLGRRFEVTAVLGPHTDETRRRAMCDLVA